MIEGDAAVVASIRLSQKPFDFCRPRIIIQCDFQTKILLNDGLGINRYVIASLWV